MSADLLTRAAARLREVSDKATPGPWLHKHHESWAGDNVVLNSEGHPVAVCGSDDPSGGYREAASTRAYIATMHPGVALALAEWLEYTAHKIDAAFDPVGFAALDGHSAIAVAVARAVLGEA